METTDRKFNLGDIVYIESRKFHAKVIAFVGEKYTVELAISKEWIDYDESELTDGNKEEYEELANHPFAFANHDVFLEIQADREFMKVVRNHNFINGK